MKGHEDLPALLMLLGVSVVGPVVAVRLKLPTPVILMLAGIALGPAGLACSRICRRSRSSRSSGFSC